MHRKLTEDVVEILSNEYTFTSDLLYKPVSSTVAVKYWVYRGQLE